MFTIVLGIGGCYSGLDAGEQDAPLATDGASSSGDGDGSAASDETDGADGSDSGDAVEGCDGMPRHAEAPLRRLSRVEYRNAVVDLIGVEPTDVADLPPDERGGTFASNSVSPIDAWSVERYRDLAEGLATLATADVAALTGCPPPRQAEPTCLRDFVEVFGRRVLRRPLADEEIARYVSIYQTARETSDFREAVDAVIETLLQSPHFLYHVEVDGDPVAGGAALRVDAYTVASRLSFLLWRTAPDDDLLDAAGRGDLDTPAGIAREAERLLDSSRSRATLEDFFQQWLAVDGLRAAHKDPVLYEEYDAALVEQMLSEPVDFVEHVLRDGDRKFSTLLSADYTVAPPELLAIYGASPGEGTVSPLDGTRRAGLLTQAAVMAATSHVDQTSPVFRGLFLRENLLCLTLPPPPPQVDNTPPPTREDATTRERFEEDHAVPECWGCHRLIDTIGFAFEHYDAIGRWRDDEHGLAIDASGEFVGVPGIASSFDGAVEMTRQLAASRQAQACFARRWYEFGLGRPQRDSDLCSVADLSTLFAESGGDIRKLVLDLVQAEAFRSKTLEEKR